MKIKDVITEAAVWKNARNPSAGAAQTPQQAAPKKPVANTGPSAFKKGLYKATGFGGKDAELAVKKDNYVKSFKSEFDNLSRDTSGAFNPTSFAQSYIQKNNWGPLNPQQQQALNSALRSKDSTKIGNVMYQIGTQNRGGGAQQQATGAAKGKPMPANADPNSKNTLGTADQLSPATSKIISQIGMLAVPSAIDDLEAILRAALNSLNKVAPGEYAEMVKMVATGQRPKPNVPQDDNPNIVRGSNE